LYSVGFPVAAQHFMPGAAASDYSHCAHSSSEKELHASS
jgi:hypothetical protein